MPRTCTICRHRDRESIERALIDGESYRHIASRFDTSTGALQRHRADHLPASLAKSHAATEVVRADRLIDEVRSGGDRAEKLYDHAELILERALESKDLKTALLAIRASVDVMGQARAYLELRGKISGELNPPEPAYPSPYPQMQGYIAFPKTPEALMEDYMILIGFTGAMDFTELESREYARGLVAKGVNRDKAFFESIVAEKGLRLIPPRTGRPMLPAAGNSPTGQESVRTLTAVEPGQRAIPPPLAPLPLPSEFHNDEEEIVEESPAADEPAAKVDRRARIKPISMFDPPPATNA